MSRPPARTGLPSASWSLGGYEPIRELGRGAAGSVYLARDSAGGREVAVKCLLGHTDRVRSRRLRREQRLLTRLEHPGIVRVYDLIATGQDLALVLEYVPGTTLRELLAAGRLTEPDALEVLRQLASALEHAHERNVVHRDLTPANVLVTPAGECKLADFGVAKLTNTTGRRSLGSFRTRTGAILGTAVYISPEAAAGVVRLDRRADLYSLGVLAYELLLGRPPFPLQDDPLATLEAHISQPPPNPTLLSSGFPDEVSTVLLQALEKRPRKRQASVRSFWEQLDRAASTAWPDWRAHADLAALVRSVSEELPRAASSGQPSTELDGAPATTLPSFLEPVSAAVFRPSARRRWTSLAVAVLGGLIAAALVLALIQAH